VNIRYNITIEAAGFKKLERPNIPLDANDKLALGNLGLQVGAVSEAVEVTAQAALLQTESVERSATMHSKHAFSLYRMPIAPAVNK